eukprot:TRINITY_DN2032_c0_g1_i3.p2 TRINITY_DN2032_c0_g1~~TRINITY_DN2032_c0_g1_i3.p2  ORF type:complete len:721 (+),score=249.85 TRINITY_DN2032_c0_g1_i3:55-2217(+)
MALGGVAAAAVLCLAARGAAAGGSAKPNVVFVLADDIGWGDVSYNTEYFNPGAGGDRWDANAPRTPNIDALATADGTMRFDRFYAGSPICSPTRATIMSGRTPERECVGTAEGCGQEPAWACLEGHPFPFTTSTSAELAKGQGYATFFAGKWHLGDFWVKEGRHKKASETWPSSNPGHHGFDVWHATEASAESSTPNCGCDPAWRAQGNGCIVGGGAWTTSEALECTNYWRWAKDAGALDAKCFEAASTDRSCVANLTQKIEGDDSEYIMDLFEAWLTDDVGLGGGQGDAKAPFFAFLWLHTNHEPHYALPEWFHKYKDVKGDWAGDYLGTISQMDAQIGRLRALLKAKGVEESTMVWFTADNGAHTAKRPGGQLAASNGLRQCKGSVFEGGIREPGFVRWPGVIGKAQQTKHMANTLDFLPTLLDIWGADYPHPSWPLDGASLYPLLSGKVPLDSPRAKAMPFSVHGQSALINDTGADGVWKIVANPEQGECKDWQPPYKKGAAGPYLFRLDVDETESHDLCHKEKTRCKAMQAALDELLDSVATSQQEESQCERKKHKHHGKHSATDDPFRRERPIPHRAGPDAVRLETPAADACLATMYFAPYEVLETGPCTGTTALWAAGAQGALTNANLSPDLCPVLQHPDCRPNNVVFYDTCGASPYRAAALEFDARDGVLRSAACPGMCAAQVTDERVTRYTSRPVALKACGADSLLFRTAPQ